MFSSPGDVQRFLSWCRENGVLKIKVGDIEAHLTPADSQFTNPQLEEATKAFESDAKPDVRLPTSEVDRELLLWSAR